MNKKFNYNFVTKTIVGTKAAIERANRGLNPEYTELTEMLAVHPDFTVTIKSIQKKEGKKTYKKLTLIRMEDYIRTQFSDEKELSQKLIEFSAIQQVAKTKGALYPLTKKWFLNTYKDFKENAVSDEEITEEQKALAAAEAALANLAIDDELIDEYEEYDEESAA